MEGVENDRRECENEELDEYDCGIDPDVVDLLKRGFGNVDMLNAVSSIPDSEEGGSGGGREGSGSNDSLLKKRERNVVNLSEGFEAGKTRRPESEQSAGSSSDGKVRAGSDKSEVILDSGFEYSMRPTADEGGDAEVPITKKDFLNAFSFDVKTKITDMTQLSLDLSRLKEVGKTLEDLPKGVSRVCPFCYNPFRKENGFYCGGCKRMGYCSALCQRIDWDGPGGSMHKEVCCLFAEPEQRTKFASERKDADVGGWVTSDQRVPPIGILGDDLMKAYIGEQYGSGLFTLRRYPKGSIVLLEAPARERGYETKARVVGQNLLKEKRREKWDKMQKRLDNGEGDEEDIDRIKNSRPEDIEITDEERAKWLNELKPSIGQLLRDDLFMDKIKLLRLLTLNTACCEITTFVPARGNGSRDVCLTVSFINHSCNPNAFLYSFGGWYLVVALKDIEVGEQITIMYDDPYSLPSKDVDPTWYYNRLWNRYGIRFDKGFEFMDEKYWEVYRSFERLSTELHANLKKVVETKNVMKLKTERKLKTKMRVRELQSSINEHVKRSEECMEKIMKKKAELMNEDEETERKIPGRFYLMVYEIICNVYAVAENKQKLEAGKKKMEFFCREIGIPPELFFGKRVIGIPDPED